METGQMVMRTMVGPETSLEGGSLLQWLSIMGET